ncbi:MAG: hypothetical protein A2600_02215 [Candidatus Lambdaproteobacteria bacterium RIFOXYD1_FULL_56_27]|uniref:Response regulatory domain-containing protein n=1 Tax=Candidatus Lambdaproteobacteria bacterium RIFOXYD2_FULL_56_26 TaxID=1817773 RepID=A0A1F6GMM9_9PROT|nr:MAG: hypothetical protein A2557_12215 [Candidatus Lambdaproteobacteria bacterium RIFOXYD2_FULL_56_26]OGH01194.1 MAG: hypothetical protein A2426_03525 [Candidatus Lambdaproteobacteria bacterium RIFOXYC1_FULL_56_13]OGH08613.1 MAG: hypothetical protein A2600_02215 [Candidatus Lambdaproteobacteria bacterium RIFOXYD1_FULL_56_27]
MDDELLSRRVMSTILSDFGEVVEAETGTQAIELFRLSLESRDRFTAITLDVDLPDFKGHQVLTEIRKLEQTSSPIFRFPTKVLMVTSHADKETVVASIQAGCDQYVIKPASPKAVLKKLQEMGVEV